MTDDGWRMSLTPAPAPRPHAAAFGPGPRKRGVRARHEQARTRPGMSKSGAMMEDDVIVRFDRAVVNDEL